MANDWMIGQNFEDTRAVDADGLAEQEYFNRLDSNQARSGASNLYDLQNGTGISETLSNAELGKIAKQTARDNQVAGEVSATKNAELGAMYTRLKDIINTKQAENDVMKQYIGSGLAGQGALR